MCGIYAGMHMYVLALEIAILLISIGYRCQARKHPSAEVHVYKFGSHIARECM